MKLFISVGLPVDNPFIVNKYTYWYYAIISSACSRHNIEGYKEQHHIIPDCFFINNRSKGSRPGWLPGDSNDSSNLVQLTSKEHFICHWLLTKMVTGQAYYKMERALWMLSYASYGRPRICSSAHYSRAKLAAILHKLHKPSPKKNKKYGKQKNPYQGPRNTPNLGKSIPMETREKISNSLKGRVSPRKGKVGEPSPKRGKDYGKQSNPAPKIKCPTCPKLISSNNLNRHMLKCNIE